MNTIDDKQNEKDFFYQCKKFEYNLDFEIFFRKNVDALLVFVVLGKNVCLYEIDYNIKNICS